MSTHIISYDITGTVQTTASLCRLTGCVISNKWLWNSSLVTNHVGEVHVQSFIIDKLWVHPAAMEDHLRHTLFYHLVVLRPEESRNTAEQLDKPQKDMSDANSTRLINHKWVCYPAQRSQNAMSKRVLPDKIATLLNLIHPYMELAD